MNNELATLSDCNPLHSDLAKTAPVANQSHTRLASPEKRAVSPSISGKDGVSMARYRNDHGRLLRRSFLPFLFTLFSFGT